MEWYTDKYRKKIYPNTLITIKDNNNEKIIEIKGYKYAEIEITIKTYENKEKEH